MDPTKPGKKRSSSRHRRSRNFIYFCSLLLIATLLTWVVGLLDNHYELLEQQGFGEVFPAQSSNWKKIGNSSLLGDDSDTLSISPETQFHTRAELLLDLPDLLIPDEKLVRIRTVAKTLERASSPSLKTDAGVLIRAIDRKGEITYHGWVSRLTGEFDTHQDEHLLPIGRSMDAILLIFTNRASDGSFSLESVDVDIVSVSPLYQLVLLPALLLMWAAALLVGIRYITSKLGPKTVLMFVGTVVVLVAGILLPSSLRELIVVPVFNQLKALGLAGENISLVHYYKIGHFLVFFVVSFILFHNARRLRIRKFDLFGIMSLLAIATEGAQLHLFFRSTQPVDVLIDIAGVALAFLLQRATRKMLKNSRRSERLNDSDKHESAKSAEGSASTESAEGSDKHESAEGSASSESTEGSVDAKGQKLRRRRRTRRQRV